MSRGRYVLGRGQNARMPKRPCSEMSFGPKRLDAEMSFGPKRPGAKTFGPKRPVWKLLGPKPETAHLGCTHESGTS